MDTFKEREWGEFKISDIFNLESENSISNSQNLSNGHYPLISARKMKNGVDSFIDTEKVNNRHAITWNKQGDGGAGLSFYQPTFFANKSTVFVLRPKLNMTKNQMLFIIPLLNKYHDIFNHGYGLTRNRFDVLKIILPIDNEKNPDWDFMEDYIRNKINKIVEKYKKYSNHLISDASENEEDIISKEWEEFPIKEIFSEIQRGKRLRKEDHISGKNPYISSSSLKNGVDNYICNEENVRIFQDCLTLANSGSVGTCFYQPFKFVASDHVTKLENNDFNKYIYLFISTILCRLSDKYSFNREINNKRLEKEKIILPVDDSGNPDYLFMENYMKQIEAEQINKYLEFIKDRV